MITLTSGSYVIRTASAWNQNADYTWLMAGVLTGQFRPAATITNGDAEFDFDGWMTRDNKLRVRSALGSTEVTTDGAATITIDGTTLYYLALQRSGSNVVLYVGTRPNNVASYATVAQAVAGRGAASQFIFNGSRTGNSFDAITSLGRGRVYTSALTLAQIKKELGAVDASLTANLWADWPIDDLGNYTVDRSGNGRSLTGTGTVTQGARLGPMQSGY